MLLPVLKTVEVFKRRAQREKRLLFVFPFPTCSPLIAVAAWLDPKHRVTTELSKVSRLDADAPRSTANCWTCDRKTPGTISSMGIIVLEVVDEDVDEAE